MAKSDAISLHMVLSPRSRGIIGAEDIGRMKKGAILINTSRGPLIDEGALVAAVEGRPDHRGAGRLRQGAAAAGPPAPRCRNTVLTPHIGYGVEETWRDFYPRSIENASPSSTARR